MEHMTDFGPMMWPWGVFMGLMWILFLGLIVLGLVYLLLRLSGETGLQEFFSGNESREGNQESPRDILDRRYAEGELTREEYEKMKEDLENR